MMYDKMFYHPSRKRNGEIAMNSKVLDIRNLTSAVSNTPTKMTPCARVVFSEIRTETEAHTLFWVRGCLLHKLFSNTVILVKY